jgi:predicted transcriptional regulator
MSFLRHVGKIGDRKVAIIFRQVPGEPHMALVTYTETLNRHIHDPMIKCIESDIGQNSKDLADALNRTHTADGKYMLQVLHQQKLIKKVQTEQVLVTPNPQTKIKLSDLNKILDEMEAGESAVKRLAEIDNLAPTDIAKQFKGTAPSAPEGVLADNAIARSLRDQAAKMELEAKGLLAESQRLQKEASDLDGVKPKKTTKKAVAVVPEAPVKKRGRPAKASVTA